MRAGSGQRAAGSGQDDGQAALATAFASRRCFRRGCNGAVRMIVVGTPSERAPGGILIARARPDRNYCLDHAPGLICHATQAPAETPSPARISARLGKDRLQPLRQDRLHRGAADGR
jgi:hypothetical protein